MPCAPLKLRIQRGSQGWEATASWSQDVGNEGMAKEQQEQRGEDAEGLPRPIQHRNFDGSPPKFQYKSHSSETPQFSAKPLLSSGTHSQCYEKQQQHPYPIPLKPSLLFPLAPLYKPSPLAGTLQTPASWARWKVVSWDISATLGQLFRNHVWHKYLFFPLCCIINHLFRWAKGYTEERAQLWWPSISDLSHPLLQIQNEHVLGYLPTYINGLFLPKSHKQPDKYFVG